MSSFFNDEQSLRLKPLSKKEMASVSGGHANFSATLDVLEDKDGNLSFHVSVDENSGGSA